MFLDIFQSDDGHLYAPDVSVTSVFSGLRQTKLIEIIFEWKQVKIEQDELHIYQLKSCKKTKNIIERSSIISSVHPPPDRR